MQGQSWPLLWQSFSIMFSIREATVWESLMLWALRDWDLPLSMGWSHPEQTLEFSWKHSLKSLEDHLQNLYAPLTLQNQTVSSLWDTAASPHPPLLQLGITWRPNMNPRIEISQLELNLTERNTLFVMIMGTIAVLRLPKSKFSSAYCYLLYL